MIITNKWRISLDYDLFRSAIAVTRTGTLRADENVVGLEK